VSELHDQIRGDYLNDLWGVGARHALYIHDGHWYHQLRRFPGALFDRNGYIKFETEEEYRDCPYLQIRKQISVPQRISSIRGYVRINPAERALAEAALGSPEAAHSYSYKGPKTNHPSNGLLLRADLHTLFDQGLFGIDTNTMTVVLAQALTRTAYADLAGVALWLPKRTAAQPSKDALDWHRREHGL
jgi:HNH endonuclease